MRMNTKVFPDLDSLSRAAMDDTLAIIRDAIAQRGRFAIALSGGHTPAKMYELWAATPYRDDTHWDRVHLFWGDERYVPHDDPLSNFRMTRETLISRVPIPRANVHPTPTLPGPPEKCAEAYEQELRKFFGVAPPEFDLQLLGLGPEGHVASLFPGAAALEEKNRWVMAVEAPAKPPQRLTLTPVVLNRGRNTFFLVAGKDKREIISALRSEPDSKPSQYPAARVRPAGRVQWFLDKAAAG
jgi:6-phosphogluconolactonase